jgi:hypothetical protein
MHLPRATGKRNSYKTPVTSTFCSYTEQKMITFKALQNLTHISRDCCKFIINLKLYAHFPKKITVNYTTSQLTKGTSQLEKVRHELEVAGKTLCLSFCRENS